MPHNSVVAFRTSFVVASLLAVCIASAQQQTVSYSTVAVSVKKALADLSEKSGMHLEATNGMENEVLILRLENASMSDVMRQIATVTSGDWTQKGDIYYLGASLGTRNREFSAANKAFQDKITAAVKKLSDAVAKTAKKQTDAKKAADDEEGFSFPGFGGGSAALTKIALAMGADNLSSVSENGRVVFSTNPTSVQRRMPANINTYLADYVREHNAQVAEQKNEEPAKDDGIPEGMGAFMEIFKPKKMKAITGPPAKVLIIAERDGLMGLSLTMKLFDTEGQMLARENLPLQVDAAFDVAEFMPDKDKPAPPVPKGKPIKLSAVAQELASMGQNIGAMQSGKMKISPELETRLKDPVAYDPLSFAHSEGLLQVAEEKHEQLVANLPDGLLSFFSSLRKSGNLDTVGFLKDLQEGDKVKVTEADGWLVAMPGNPYGSRSERTDRKSLKKLLDASISQGYLSLDDLAAYAQSNAAPLTEAPASTVYIMLYAPGAMQQGMMGMMNWDLVRFYGTLGATQKESIKNGGQIAFNSLNPGQRTIVSQMLFGPANDLTVTADKKTDGDPLTNMMMRQMSRFMPGSTGDYRTEPTEIMPNGLPANGYIAVKYSSEPVGVPVGMNTSFGEFQAMGPMELGMIKMIKDDPKMANMSGAIPEIPSLRVGTRVKYDFSFVVAQNVEQTGTLQDDHIAKDATVYKYENLPQDFQDQIAKMAAAFKKNPIFSAIGQMGNMGRQAPPPR